jgi:hypothetical protein
MSRVAIETKSTFSISIIVAAKLAYRSDRGKPLAA